MRWPFTRDGMFSVRSAYHALTMNQSDIRGPPAGNDRWKAIWGAKAWPEVKVFMWKLLENALSLRGIPTSPLCPFCEEEETAQHLVLGCAWNHSIWVHVLNLDVAGANAGQTAEWIFDEPSNGSNGRVFSSSAWEVCMLNCWAVWKGRCKFVFEHKMPNTFAVVHEIQRAAAEVLRARSGTSNTVETRQTGKTR